MAFMMPVMKNNYDIYKDSRSRKTSECSNASTGSGAAAAALASAPAGAMRPTRKSESFASSPSHHGSHTYRMQMQRCQSSRAFPRNPSRTSHSSAFSPTRSFCHSSSGGGGGGVGVGGATNAMSPSSVSTPTSPQRSPPKGQSGSGSGGGNGNGNETNNNELMKFHLRLVEKLRKSFRKDNGTKRS